MDVPFPAYPKLYRLNRTWVATEKIDGTNGLVFVPEDPTEPVRAGSHKRWLQPASPGNKAVDNFGFAAWVQEHAEELRALGPGHHYGEWWGKGVQRGYNQITRRWSLFDFRWGQPRPEHPQVRADYPCLERKPACCDVVPVLAVGTNVKAVEQEALNRLNGTMPFDEDTCEPQGSWAAPGFPFPEGIVLFHEPSHTRFKVLLENDAGHKGEGQ